MIEFKVGNILEASTQALVNTVNCEGYMGKGIAYQFKRQFPLNNEVYVEACKKGYLKIGIVLPVRESQKIILNFPTKNKWREKSKYEYIEKGLTSLKNVIIDFKVESISIPPLGCGNGGLDWLKVRDILVKSLEELPSSVLINIYEPSQNIEQSSTVKKIPKLNTSHLLLMGIKLRLHKFNKIRLQKTAFLINYLSHQRYFKFEPHHFGPYAHSLEILSKDIKEYQDYFGFNTEQAYEHAKTVLISNNIIAKENSFAQYLEAATAMSNAIKTEKELELITTLIYIIEENYWLNEDKIITLLHEWSAHKAEAFPPEMIKETLTKLVKENLIQKELLGLAPHWSI